MKFAPHPPDTCSSCIALAFWWHADDVFGAVITLLTCPSLLIVKLVVLVKEHSPWIHFVESETNLNQTCSYLNSIVVPGGERVLGKMVFKMSFASYHFCSSPFGVIPYLIK